MPQKRLTAVGRVLGEQVADHGDLGGQLGEGGGGAAIDADGDAHRAGDADGRRAAHDHVADDGRDLLVVGREDVGLLEGELGLVEKINAFGEPFESRNHVVFSLLRFCFALRAMWAARTSLAVKTERKGAPWARGFDVGAATLLAVDQAEDAGDDHAGLARGFDGGDGASRRWCRRRRR